MAKNYVQDGNSIEIVNAAADIASGDPVAVGDLVVVAITDIPKGGFGTGRTAGVFSLPKVAADVITAGAKVYLKGGKVQLAEADAVAAGHAWSDAGKDAAVVEVRING